MIPQVFHKGQVSKQSFFQVHRLGAAGGDAPRHTSSANSETMMMRLLQIRTCFLVCPLILGVERVKENWFSLSFIAAPSCQIWRRAATGMFPEERKGGGMGMRGGAVCHMKAISAGVRA